MYISSLCSLYFSVFSHCFSSLSFSNCLGPLTYVYGNTQQYRLPGKYSGNQCTSMAVAAIVHQKAFANITPVGINAILNEGHKLHARLRYATTVVIKL